MEQQAGSVNLDKVINVKPLRCLVPMFSSPPGMSSSSSPQTAPFVCAPPSGPFPPNYNSFFPFSDFQNPVENSQGPYGFNNSIPAPVPLSSYKGLANGDIKSSKKKETIKKKPRATNAAYDAVMDRVANKFLTLFNLTMFEPTKNDGNIEIVEYALMIMNFLRRRLMQSENPKETTSSVMRPDLKAGAFLMSKGIRTNMRKRVGAVPGVEVGDIFYFRMEMCLVGMHTPTMAGIDYMSLKINETEEEPVAVSVVSSGGYDDNNDEADVLIYSGHGGKDVSDQKLEKGNLALEKSLHRGNEIRVIRGLRDTTTIFGKIYLYDGLYKVQESWIERGQSGFNIFKYKMVRMQNQPPGFSLWKSVNQWKENMSLRPGVILQDLSSGWEALPVSLVNEMDGEKGPAFFNYYPGLKYSKPVNLPQISSCSCQSACQSGNRNCPCVQRNGGSFPYSAQGVLLTCKSIIHECGSLCSCPATCENRVTGAGIKVRLEVFRTRDRGWGLRSLDPIRSGAFICEYAGEVIDKSTAEQFGRNGDDNFIFDSSRRFEPNEIMFNSSDESSKLPFPVVISAKNIGNVARFMNHSCSPNVYWQPLMREKDNESPLHIVFFAINNIAPMRELTYDYGIIMTGNGEYRRKKCLCGSIKCRGFFH